ncbi:hypothetical protein Daura_00175 [Dactylosporangium aurantiacum]|uniref:Uncharacterized protein n=1 Tax=Dactylosporangium aurantiacum TaxID=35754 RepID=A0A9Q9IKK6_9ACTN|nr:hypothetical protein [Dactylosporangium aurantiacum]MDG6101218.1 hypothetical protein [Dactylosporangium aurantiacum]UWZ54763.1 hypothetical protein Daura_00175 [Dactylosporangium aurantiacum]
MAQSRSERNPRTARCARSAARLAVKGLVVAGFAGVAWLLSASAAQASESAGADGFGSVTSLLGPVTNLVTGGGGAGLDLLDLGAGGNRHGASGGHIGSTGVPSGGATHESKRDLLTGTVLTVLRPVTGTVLTTTGGVTDKAADQAATPASGRMPRLTTVNASSATNSRTKRPAKAGITNARRTQTQEPAVQAVPVGVGSTDDVVAAATGTSGAGVDSTRVVVSRASDQLDRLDAGDATHVKPVADRTDAQGTRHVPLLPRPAPVPAPAVGVTSGAPGTVPGLNHDGGATATLPAAPAGTKVLTFRLDAVDDAELRLLAAEKPTVSPD